MLIGAQRETAPKPPDMESLSMMAMVPIPLSLNILPEMAVAIRRLTPQGRHAIEAAIVLHLGACLKLMGAWSPGASQGPLFDA